MFGKAWVPFIKMKLGLKSITFSRSSVAPEIEITCCNYLKQFLLADRWEFAFVVKDVERAGGRTGGKKGDVGRSSRAETKAEVAEKWRNAADVKVSKTWRNQGS